MNTACIVLFVNQWSWFRAETLYLFRPLSLGKEELLKYVSDLHKKYWKPYDPLNFTKREISLEKLSKVEIFETTWKRRQSLKQRNRSFFLKWHFDGHPFADTAQSIEPGGWMSSSYVNFLLSMRGRSQL